MAIAYAGITFITRSKGQNACKRAAYNGNCSIKDLRIGQTFNFSRLKTNIYHEVLLPEDIDEKFKNVALLMNEVERTEKQKNSQLLREYVLALPQDIEITIKHKIALTKRFIQRLEFLNYGLAVVIDLHQPDSESEENINWYSKLLVTTRKFDKVGQFLDKKVRDFGAELKFGKGRTFVSREKLLKPGQIWGEVQNKYFAELGLKLRVDEIGIIPQEHIGLKKYGIIAEEKRKRKQEK